MDVDRLIRELLVEKARIDYVIAQLEAIDEAKGGISDKTGRKRRGRLTMGPEERMRVSERMKQYWRHRRPPSSI